MGLEPGVAQLIPSTVFHQDVANESHFDEKVRVKNSTGLHRATPRWPQRGPGPGPIGVSTKELIGKLVFDFALIVLTFHDFMLMLCVLCSYVALLSWNLLVSIKSKTFGNEALF